METVNRLLREARALPQLVKHDQLGLAPARHHPEAPLADRMGTEAAMALVDVIRSKEMDRMLVCAADDCDAVVLDLSRNRSKRYCERETAPTARTWRRTGRAAPAESTASGLSGCAPRSAACRALRRLRCRAGHRVRPDRSSGGGCAAGPPWPGGLPGRAEVHAGALPRCAALSL